jgi:putative endopeptidase
MKGTIAVIAVLFGALLAAPTAQDRPLESGLDLSGFDKTVRPQDDLFRFVNGAWLERTSIPADRVTYGMFLELADRVEADIRTIAEAAIDKGHRARGAERQIANLYASVIDQDRVEARGLDPVRRDLQRIEEVKSARELAAEAGRLSAIAAGGPFPGAIEELPSNPGRPFVNVSQGGTLLPDRDYYLNNGEPFAGYREAYSAYLTDLFALSIRRDRAGAAVAARSVLALETEIARLQWPREDLRDPTRTAKTYTLAELAREMPGFAWSAWAQPLGIEASGSVILSQPSFFKGFSALIDRFPLDTWKAWLVARFLTANAPYLPAAIANLRFEFFGRVLTGQELPRAFWKRGVALVNLYLGDEVGRLYVEKRFPPRSKARAEKLVDAIVAAFRSAISDSAWLSPAAKRAALVKLSKMKTSVGYPSRWRSYAAFDVKQDDLFGNIQRAKALDTRYQLERFAARTDAGEWLMTPQTVNAYYSPARNEIVVPAAMLQPPLFNSDADDAANYGAIGAVVGHEIGHGFDERGRLFDGNGMTGNWWTPEDERAFDTISRAMVDQFGALSPLPGVRVNGFVTLRENIGDLSGLAIAWRAYKMSLGGRPSPVLDGFTGEQRFFLSWAQVWRGHIREEYLRQTLLSMPHAPPQYRANTPASNLAGFHDAFGVKPGDRMFRPPSAQVVIW